MFREALNEHKYLLAVCLSYMLCALAACVYVDADMARVAVIAGMFIVSIIPYFFMPLVYFLVRAAFVPRQGSFLGQVQSDFDSFLASIKFKRGIAALAAIAPLLTFFCIFKSLFPVLARGNMDGYFAALDERLHGALPHVYFLPWVEKFHLLPALELVYFGWFILLFAGLVYALFLDSDAARRMRFLWSFVLSWIIPGTVLALIFYSAGPVFYHLVKPDSPDLYADLRQWISSSSASYDVAMFLYSSANDALRPDINAPSAMPSQHVGIAWLIAMYAANINKRLGIAVYGFALLIFVASIVLGWHYAVDGYAGIIAASVLWCLTGKLRKGTTQ